MNRIPHPYLRGELVAVIDCRDLDRASRFWTAALGYVPESEDDAATQDDATSEDPAESTAYRSLVPGDGRGIEILLQRTADAKVSKNRLHLDLRTPDLDAEVSRVTALGATLLTTAPVKEEGWTWHILGDPDGNEFCVLQPPASYWKASKRQ